MTGLCPICQHGNRETASRFVELRQWTPVFNLLCEGCWRDTEVDAKGDLWRAEGSAGG